MMDLFGSDSLDSRKIYDASADLSVAGKGHVKNHERADDPEKQFTAGSYLLTRIATPPGQNLPENGEAEIFQR